MTTPNLSPTPAAPQRSDPTTFRERADAFLAWWSGVITELNQFISWANDAMSSITSSSSYWTAINAVSASNINCSLGVYFTKAVNGAIAFTFSNPPSVGKVYSFTLRIDHTSGAITWPSGVRWVEGVIPALIAGKTHLFVFTTDDGGATWRGAALANF